MRSPKFNRKLKLAESIWHPVASLVAQRLKRLPPMRESRVWSLGWEDPLEKEMAAHSSTPAWRIPWTEEPGRLQSTGLQRVGHDWVTSLHVTSVFTQALPSPEGQSVFKELRSIQDALKPKWSFLWLKSDQGSYSPPRIGISAWTGPIYPRLPWAPSPPTSSECSWRLWKLWAFEERRALFTLWLECHCPGPCEWLALWHHFTELTIGNVIALSTVWKTSWPFRLGSLGWLHIWVMSDSKLSSEVFLSSRYFMSLFHTVVISLLDDSFY